MKKFMQYIVLSALLYTCCSTSDEKLHIRSFTIEGNPVTFHVYGVLLGRDVTLQCDVTSQTSRDVTLELTRQGETIHSSEKNTTIVYTLKNITCENTGQYICKAQDSTNKDSRTAYVNVQFCPPKLCQQNDIIRVVSAPIGKDQQVSTCVFTHVNSDQYPIITLNGKTHLKKNTHSSKYAFQWLKNGSRMYHTAVISVKNVTEKDYGAMEVNLKISTKKSMNFTIYYMKPDDSYSVDFTVNNTEAIASESSPVTLSCKASAFRPVFRLYRRGNESELARHTGNLDQQSELLHTLSGTCGETGGYVCFVEDVRGVGVRKELDLAFKNCPPTSCDGESTSKTSLANISDNITISFCVMTFNAIDPVLEIDGVKYRFNDTSQRFHFNIATEGCRSQVSIDIYNVEFKDFEEHRVKIGEVGFKTSTQLTFQIININNEECDPYKRTMIVFTHIGGSATSRFCVPPDELWLNKTIALNEETYPFLSNGKLTGKVKITLDSTVDKQYGFFMVDIYNVQLHDFKQYNFVTATGNYTVDLQLQKDSLQLCNNSDQHRFKHAKLGGKILLHTCIALNKSTSNSTIFVDFNGTEFQQMGCNGNKCALWTAENAMSVEYTFSVKIDHLSDHDFGTVSTRVGLYNEGNDSVISEVTFTLQIEMIYAERSNTALNTYGIRTEEDDAVQSGLAPNTILVITMGIFGTLFISLLVGYLIQIFKGRMASSNRNRRGHHVTSERNDVTRPTSEGVPPQELQPIYLNTENSFHRMGM